MSHQRTSRPQAEAITGPITPPRAHRPGHALRAADLERRLTVECSPGSRTQPDVTPQRDVTTQRDITTQRDVTPLRDITTLKVAPEMATCARF